MATSADGDNGMKTLSWDDSNAYRWTARKPDAGGMWTVTVEADAPYKRRTAQAPGTMTESQLRAFVEASVSIPERVAPSAKRKPVAAPKKAASPRPVIPPSVMPNQFPVDEVTKPKPATSKAGSGMLVLLAIAALVIFGKKKGR